MKFIVFISGNGSNLQEVINFCDNSNDHKILQVMCNHDDVPGIKRCQTHSIPYSIFEFKKSENYKSKSKSDKQIERDLYENNIYQKIKEINGTIQSRICILCLGWMHIFGKNFIDNINSLQFTKFDFQYNSTRIFNLHPSLPFDDKLIGTNSIDRAWKQYCNNERVVTGIMMHKLIPEVDKGNYINLEVLNITKCLGYSDYKIKMNNIEKKVVNEFLNIIINDITHLYK